MAKLTETQKLQRKYARDAKRGDMLDHLAEEYAELKLNWRSAQKRLTELQNDGGHVPAVRSQTATVESLSKQLEAIRKRIDVASAASPAAKGGALKMYYAS